MKLKGSLLACVGAVFILLGGALGASSTKSVFPGNWSGWFLFDDNTNTVDNSLGEFVLGPASVPLGTGSLEIATIGNGRPNVATYQFTGTPLASITELNFSTYNGSAGNPGPATRSGYLQFNVDFTGVDNWQRRLVFAPRDSGTVLQDSWQEWDAINNGAALWRYSGGKFPGTNFALMTWAQILSTYPGVRIRVSDPFLGIRVGEPYPNGYVENIDAFKFGTEAGTTVFNFEAKGSDVCKKNLWMMLVRADDTTFKNQGDCVSYANSGR